MLDGRGSERGLRGGDVESNGTQDKGDDGVDGDE